MNTTKVFLKPGKEVSVKRRHPWVFSGAIAQIEGFPKPGDVVSVSSSKNEVLGYGHWAEGSITVRLFSFSVSIDGKNWWRDSIRKAFEMRRQLGFVTNSKTNVYRLLNAEGDGMPGLVIDIYGSTAVMQAHSVGMHKELEDIAAYVVELFGGGITSVFDKSAEKLGKNQAAAIQNKYINGEPGNNVVIENENQFQIDWEEGQKTGFFIDQRENRALVGRYSAGRKVLNAFCYTGGFSVYALRNGAERVDSVDSSQKAIELTDRNIQLNGFENLNHQSIKADAVEYMRNLDAKFDLMILDPPAFAKHLSARHNAVQAYRRINEAAIKQIEPGGLIFTFSCSQAVDVGLFRGAITAAAIDAGRNVRILHTLGQPADHPVSIFHPEGEYLKGLVLQVE